MPPAQIPELREFGRPLVQHPRFMLVGIIIVIAELRRLLAQAPNVLKPFEVTVERVQCAESVVTAGSLDYSLSIFR